MAVSGELAGFLEQRDSQTPGPWKCCKELSVVQDAVPRSGFFITPLAARPKWQDTTRGGIPWVKPDVLEQSMANAAARARQTAAKPPTTPTEGSASAVLLSISGTRSWQDVDVISELGALIEKDLGHAMHRGSPGKQMQLRSAGKAELLFACMNGLALRSTPSRSKRRGRRR